MTNRRHTFAGIAAILLLAITLEAGPGRATIARRLATPIEGWTVEINENPAPECGGYDVVSFGFLAESFDWEPNQIGFRLIVERTIHGISPAWTVQGDFTFYDPTDDLRVDIARVSYECGTVYDYRGTTERIFAPARAPLRHAPKLTRKGSQ